MKDVHARLHVTTPPKKKNTYKLRMTSVQTSNDVIHSQSTSTSELFLRLFNGCSLAANLQGSAAVLQRLVTLTSLKSGP